MFFFIIAHFLQKIKAFFAVRATFFASAAAHTTGRHSSRAVAAAALSQKSHSGRISGDTASRYTAAPSPIPVSITGRSSPRPIRRAYHNSAGPAASRNAASSPWVRCAFFLRRSRTSRSRSYTAPAAAPSPAAVR